MVAASVGASVEAGSFSTASVRAVAVATACRSSCVPARKTVGVPCSFLSSKALVPAVVYLP